MGCGPVLAVCMSSQGVFNEKMRDTCDNNKSVSTYNINTLTYWSIYPYLFFKIHAFISLNKPERLNSKPHKDDAHTAKYGTPVAQSC